ncbi:DUF6182 family protein [Micromonospora cathayae]|uniref:DUF6182 family protein n=1 Tax=Micromonospora cathayae TaxID=3028804 RepID=A0ABY7ZJF9_9ACTN|nr:DUF6182 family protein [Micromonospora sp. HUAS 3]WDZ83120.1 DUF6182 family protein [Micromonospora sp. HUAS 3]
MTDGRQEFLAGVLRERMRRAGVDADGWLDPPAGAGDPHVGAGPAAPSVDLTAVVVLNRFDPVALAGSAPRFAASLDPEQGRAWLAAFTRTVFLAGNPANLRERFGFARVDAGIAWYGPAPAAEVTGLRRLVKLFPAGPLTVPAELVVPGGAGAGGRAWRLAVATDGLTIADYLVHVNHTLVEAVVTGVLPAGEPLVVTHLPDLDDATLGAADAVRVHRDRNRPDRLRAYACLTAPGSR